jgi:hypothetical protein
LESGGGNGGSSIVVVALVGSHRFSKQLARIADTKKG